MPHEKERSQHNSSHNSNNGKFIQKAIKRPGAFTAKAKKAGALTSKGTIKKSFTRMEAKKGGLTGQQARLAMTLSKLRKKK